MAWTCTGGTVDSNRAYVAPSTFGTYTVTATSVADSSLKDSATVVVFSMVGSDKNFTYDLNGNLTDDGSRTFEWDAENRLVAVTITATGHRSEFGYDGMGRRFQIRELDPDQTQALQVTSDKKYLWDGVEIVEERDATGAMVNKRFYIQGFVDSDGTILFYTRDHLGSVRELTDNAQAVRARYDYDPYGRMTKVQGDRDSAFTYTGHFWHAQSGLNLTKNRAYDPNLGRWISRDPLLLAEQIDGPNVYAYVIGDPINLFDPLGLSSCSPCDEYKKSHPNVTGGRVICKDGKPNACSYGYPGLPSGRSGNPGVADCIMQHEKAHFPDVKCNSSSDPYAAAPLGDGDASEVSAYAASIRCIERKLKNMSPDDPNYRDYRKYRDDSIQNYRGYYGVQHPGVYAPWPPR